jgi:hypothetical protein
MTSKTVLLLPLVLRAPSERQWPHIFASLQQDWVILSSRGVWAVCFKGPWEGGRRGIPLLESPRRILLLGFSICWYFANSWHLQIHPPTGFPESKSQNILAEWVMDHRWQRIFFFLSSVICFFLEAKPNPTSHSYAFCVVCPMKHSVFYIFIHCSGKS